MLIFITLTSQSVSALAGARGLRVVLIGIDADDFFESKAYTSMFSGGVPQLSAATECWRNRATGGFSIDTVARIKIPQGIDRELAQSIWNGDQQAIKKAQKILKTPHEAIQNKSYDGMFIVQVVGDTISLMGIGSNAPRNKLIPIKKIDIQWNRENASETTANFDLAQCKAAKPMDYGFSP